MIIVFEHETGGVVEHLIPSGYVNIVSGYVQTVFQRRAVLNHVGTVSGNKLYIPKSLLQGLEEGYYTYIPQLVDSSGAIWFLEEQDLIVRSIQ